jgi:hypothetical protein
MKKRQIRCFRALADASGTFNNEVIYPASDGYRLELAICIRCGELFLVDREDPLIGSQPVDRLVEGTPCPKCGTSLGQSIRDYPDTFIGRDGRLGTYLPPTWIPSDRESFLVDFWVIEGPSNSPNK